MTLQEAAGERRKTNRLQPLFRYLSNCFFQSCLAEKFYLLVMNLKTATTQRHYLARSEHRLIVNNSHEKNSKKQKQVVLSRLNVLIVEF